MKESRYPFLLLIGASLLCVSCALGDEVVLTAPGYDHINPFALDQPEQDGVLLYDGEVIFDNGAPVIIDMFIDTGASGFVISQLNAVGYDYEPILGFGYEHIPSLGLEGDPSGEFVGVFSETGIGGQELGDVTRPLGVRLLNAPQGSSLNPADFVDYGEHSLWVRRDIGNTEVVQESIITLVDPLHVAGMPVISQRVLVMDPTPLANLNRMETLLLPHGDASIPQTNITFSTRLVDLVGTPPVGETLPSTASNPFVQGITISHTSGATTNTITDNEWLFDTGAGGTLVSFAKAQAVGLIDPSYADFNDYLQDHISAGGPTGQLGGIGPNLVTAPILQLDEIRITAKEGFDVVWENVAVMVIDVEDPSGEGEALEGVLGMNLLLPAVNIDLADPLGIFDDISPGYFDAIVFDSTDANKVELRLYSDLAPPPRIMGDADLDGYIDDNDLNLLLTSWYQQGIWGNGDFTGDGFVNDDDLNLLLTNWHEGIPPMDQGAVPEPATMMLLLGGFALIRIRRE